MTLDDAIREAIAKGCTGITLWHSADGCQANARGKDGNWRVGIDADPVAALFKALRQQPAPPPPSGDLFE